MTRSRTEFFFFLLCKFVKFYVFNVCIPSQYFIEGECEEGSVGQEGRSPLYTLGRVRCEKNFHIRNPFS